MCWSYSYVGDICNCISKQDLGAALLRALLQIPEEQAMKGSTLSCSSRALSSQGHFLLSCPRIRPPPTPEHTSGNWCHRCTPCQPQSEAWGPVEAYCPPEWFQPWGSCTGTSHRGLQSGASRLPWPRPCSPHSPAAWELPPCAQACQSETASETSEQDAIFDGKLGVSSVIT